MPGRLDWLLPLLPRAHHYCEPYGGSVAVLINREPSPVETYNDLDGEVVNFFRVLRDKREELIAAIEQKDNHVLSDVERARLFYIRARQARTGRGSIEDLSQRLLRVQIENRPAIEVIRRYDSPQTLFYCDPHEMTDKEHEELAEVLHSVKGMAALSSYRCRLMDDLYGDWKCIVASEKKCHSIKALWVNYDIESPLQLSP